MIFDHIVSAGQYTGLSANFEKAFRYLQGLNFSAVSEGETLIDGCEVFASANPSVLKRPEDIPYEAHGEYADIQLLIRGSEAIYVARTSQLEQSSSFDGQKDIGFYRDGGHSIRLALFPGDFAVFFPEDAHKPCCFEQTSDAFKVVVKVRLEPAKGGTVK